MAGCMTRCWTWPRAARWTSWCTSRPPIICDESLVQYDDGRALTCLKYLHELGSEYQILLLTCHDRERKVALELGANVIPL